MIFDIIRVWWRLWLSDGHTIIQRYRGKTANKQTNWWSQNDEKICEKNSVKLWKKYENTVEKCENMVTLSFSTIGEKLGTNKQKWEEKPTDDTLHHFWYVLYFALCTKFYMYCILKLKICGNVATMPIFEGYIRLAISNDAYDNVYDDGWWGVRWCRRWWWCGWRRQYLRVISN